MARAGPTNTQMGTEGCDCRRVWWGGEYAAPPHSLTNFFRPASPDPAPPFAHLQVPIQEASRVLKRPEMLAALAAMESTIPGNDAL